ncbi:hypothetical protein K437DRAFT_257965 [Tilletiaria anomala UBC 951]|uniref:RRM domain-containing protein n=1 Tax=Tilletiaria anomala (strain ATCC 24038 / CBS 436.72 / UBC 951) TaxID=1037660 RepID=A0A066VUD5_TILAU|nr:uncharacterized protein K437DRAFT_257965 [Tilletiaria anomala UBC 951]KDN42185.1 hypothetical protein K437DRAFT_257965 [Tilletiaria anomala UBC 951]
MTATTSRLIIRNLPPHTTQTSLSEHFSALPSTSSLAQDGSSQRITDVKLMHKPDGTFRRFAFLGYKSALDAQRAQEYFDGTFFGTSKIRVEFARSISEAKQDGATAGTGDKRTRDSAAGPRDSGTERAGKRQKAASADHGPEPKAKRNKPSGKEVTFEEFMAVMQPKSKRKTWANEEAPMNADGNATTANCGQPGDDSIADDDDDVQDLTDLTKQKKEDKERRKEEKRKKKAHLKGELANDSTAAKNEAAEGIAGAQNEPDEQTESEMSEKDIEMTDAEYFASRMRRHIGTGFEEEGKDEVHTETRGPGSSSGASGSDNDSEAGSSSISKDVSAAAAARAIAAEERARIAKEEDLRKEQEAVDIIMQTSRLLVRNLPFTTSEDELKEWFEKWGEVRYARIPVDKITKVSKGIGFVTFVNAPDALLAYRANDGSTFQGRLLHLLPAVDQHPEGLPAPVSEKKKSLKEQRLEERKRKAADGKDSFNWSSFYMSADAVANSIAERMGISKNDIVNPDESAGTSAAVRLALAETKVIQETKEFLKQHGVDISALEGAGVQGEERRRRNDCVILVKNFPFGTTDSEIRNLFSRFGEVATVLLPPAGTFAMVEMPIANEAREAFRALAYTRFKDKPIYLEKAPEGIFVSKSDGAAPGAASTNAKLAPGSKLAAKLGGEGAFTEHDIATGADALAATATIFVKNLSFSTTDARLTQAFQHLPNFVFARVQMKTSNAAPGKAPIKLSMGYGFVGFRMAEAAKQAIESMQGTALDGHVLSLKFAHQDASAAGGSSGDGASAHGGSAASRSSNTTLLVKNLPFEASKKEVRQLFEAHGQIKSVRVPKKLDRSARGFGFVEFVSRREAVNAMEALKHTHLLGRHLVLKWAQDEDASRGVDVSVERARGKARVAAAAQSAAPEMGGAKRSKMKLGAEDIAKAAAQERQRRDDVEEEDGEDLEG